MTLYATSNSPAGPGCRQRIYRYNFSDLSHYLSVDRRNHQHWNRGYCYGIASDAGGSVGGVEISGDGGTTWHPATGRASWNYVWTPGTTGPTTWMSRAVDDSGNVETAHGISLTVVPQACPCRIWSSSVAPQNVDKGDGNAVELGLKFRTDSDGSILSVRFYKAPANIGTHIGHVWSSTVRCSELSPLPARAVQVGSRQTSQIQYRLPLILPSSSPTLRRQVIILLTLTSFRSQESTILRFML
jgi:hypothetical protein